jgi:hypothetical protein
MSGDQLPSWRETPAKQSIVAFVETVTNRDWATLFTRLPFNAAGAHPLRRSYGTMWSRE